MAQALTMAGGIVIGLGASLHCAGMCGGIAAMTVIPAGQTATAALRTGVAVHAGRISAYALLGGAAGGLGTAVIGTLEPSVGYHLLRWAAALSLGWVGLSTAGLMPGPGSMAGRLSLLLGRCGRPAGGSALLAGFGWGLMPCSMVYGALLYALFTGSAMTGALIMAGFGVGTLPALAGAGVAFAGLRAVARHSRLRLVAGLGIAIVGMLSLLDPGPAFTAACRTLGM